MGICPSVVLGFPCICLEKRVRKKKIIIYGLVVEINIFLLVLKMFVKKNCLYRGRLKEYSKRIAITG